MPTFADSLSKNWNDALFYAQATLRQELPYWEAAIKYQCEQNRTARHMSGLIVQAIPAEPGYIRQPEECLDISPQEYENRVRKALNKPTSEHKHMLYRDSAGRYIRSGVYTAPAEWVDTLVDGLSERIRELGFVHYTVKPYPLDSIERTTKPAAFLSPVKVTDTVVGKRYALYVDIRW